MHALIIEQDSWITLMIEDVLRDLGFSSFAFAASPEAALASAGQHCPDLITAEVRLGAASGIEVVREICAGKEVAVLFVTATPWEVRTADAGAAVVPKPFCSASLKDGVGRATATMTTGDGPAGNASPLLTPDPDPQPAALRSQPVMASLRTAAAGVTIDTL